CSSDLLGDKNAGRVDRTIIDAPVFSGPAALFCRRFAFLCPALLHQVRESLAAGGGQAAAGLLSGPSWCRPDSVGLHGLAERRISSLHAFGDSLASRFTH